MIKKNPPKSKQNTTPLLTPEQLRIVLYIAVAAVIAAVLLAIVWRTIVEDQNKQQFEQQFEALAQSHQQKIANYQQGVMQKLQAYAQMPELQTVLSEESNLFQAPLDSPQLAGVRQRIQSELSCVQTLRFYWPRQAQREKNQGEDVSFVVLNMINRVERNKKEVYPEITKIKDSAERRIHWVVPVYKKAAAKEAKQLLAILHVATKIDEFWYVFSDYDQNLAHIQLVQKIGRQRSQNLLIVGRGKSYQSKVIEIPQSHWQLVLTASDALFKKAASIPIWFVFLALVILGALTGYAYFVAQKKNKRQAALYQSMTSVKKQVEQAEEEEKPEVASDPLFLTDQQLDAADEALIAGEHKQKQDGGKGSEVSMQGVAVASHIFRAYDIRGVVDEELTSDLAEALGRAIASEALEQGENALLVGYDARVHSPGLYESLTKGVLSTGCDVIQIGLVPTPLMNFATYFSDRCSSGVVVTASHNPKQYNGFKVVINEQILVDSDIKKLYQRVTEGLFIQGDSAGKVLEESFAEAYIDAVISDIVIADMNIVVDAANGSSSELAPAVFEELGCEVTPLYCEFNGEFPNHEPDPTIAENLQALVEKVQEVNADLGVALDGDGDRLVVVTASGRIVWPDQLLMLFARDVVARNPGCDVIFDIKSTRQLNQVVSSYGGRPIMWKTGHSHIKAKMRETGALLAGEYSGHIFFKERWYGFDDGVYAAARLMEIMSLRDQSLDDMLSAIPPLCSTPEIKVLVSEEDKFDIVNALIDKGDFSRGEKTTIDGLRVDFAKGWGLVRASNTAAALTLRFEAENEEAVQHMQALFKRELKKIDSSLELDF